VTTAVAPPTAPAPVPARASRHREHATTVTVAIAIGAAVTFGMWLRHGGLSNATGPGGVATAAGQVAALGGTYAILIQLLLMSRIAWLERAIGLDRLVQWHRWTGFTAVSLLTAHVVLTTLGWAHGAIPPVNVFYETGWFIAHEPDILMAWIGFLLLVAIAVTSVRAARRTLRRETWYFVHLYAYLAVALAFAHQLAVGSDFNGDAAARVWWVTLYALVFGAILYWRVLVPIVFNAQHRFRVTKVRREAPGVVSIVLRGRHTERIDAEPGQFFFWRFLTPTGWWQAHPFSLSAAPSGPHLRITIKSLGDHTSRLQRIRPGTRVLAEGPYGTFTNDRRRNPRVLLIAGGIGITPLRALLDAFHPGDDVVLLYRVVRDEDVIFRDELSQFAASHNITIHIITGSEIGDDRTDLLGVEALRRGVPDIRARDCYVCGPPALTDAVVRRLGILGVPRSQVHFERFEL